MKRTLVDRWESWSPWRQMAVAYPAIAIVLFAAHVALFPKLTIGRVTGYAIFEAVPLAGVVLIATASEVARKRNAAAADVASAPSTRDDE